MSPPYESYEEEQLAELLRLLPPAPAAWVEAAKELPSARRSLDDLVERARADAELRRAVISDLEAALEREGVEPIRPLVERLRRELSK
jgi:hypothetical protein